MSIKEMCRTSHGISFRSAIPAIEAEAFGRGNSGRFPVMRDTIRITRDAAEVGVVMAHELFHVLADSGRHETDPDNLMYERSDGNNTRLDDWQCERLRKEPWQGNVSPRRGQRDWASGNPEHSH